MIINNGGPAFPSQLQIHPHSGERILDESQGMSLRDWFAGQALFGYCSSDLWRKDADREQTAKSAYGMADAMIAERNKTEYPV